MLNEVKSLCFLSGKKILLFIILFYNANFIEGQIWNITYTPVGNPTIYDMVSLGSPQVVYQDPTMYNYIHLVLVYAPAGDPWGTFPNRRTKYYHSTNKGLSWSFITDLPNTSPTNSAFASITTTSDGCAIVSNTSYYGTNNTRGQLFVDVFPGLGGFTRIFLDTGTTYVKWVSTQSITFTNKAIILATKRDNNSNPAVYKNILLSLTNQNFSGWSQTDAAPFDCYSIAKSISGKIGIVYRVNENYQPGQYGCVYFMESTDNGTSFSIPLKIYQAKFTGGNADSLGANKGLSLAYCQDIPVAVFELVKQNTSGIIYPAGNAKIMCWASTLPGSDPERCVKIADTSNIPYPRDSLSKTDPDNYGFLSRPVAGASSTNNALFVAFQVKTGRKGGIHDTVNFKKIYFTYGKPPFVSWRTPVNISPAGSLTDWSYPSISPWNDYAYPYFLCYVTALSDSIPGTYVNSQQNGESQARMNFIKLSILTNINQINTEIPEDFILYQNYPNPFNPVTKIKFEISPFYPPLGKGGNGGVSLKIFDILGKEITTLVNEQLSPGTYEVTFDGSNLPSGIYFYQLRCGEYMETKKLVFLK